MVARYSSLALFDGKPAFLELKNPKTLRMQLPAQSGAGTAVVAANCVNHPDASASGAANYACHLAVGGVVIWSSRAEGGPTVSVPFNFSAGQSLEFWHPYLGQQTGAAPLYGSSMYGTYCRFFSLTLEAAAEWPSCVSSVQGCAPYTVAPLDSLDLSSDLSSGGASLVYNTNATLLSTLPPRSSHLMDSFSIGASVYAAVALEDTTRVRLLNLTGPTAVSVPTTSS